MKYTKIDSLMTKHLTLPWKITFLVDSNGNSTIDIISEKDGMSILTMHSGGWIDKNKDLVNAEFIIKACNSYYKLLEIANNVRGLK